MSLRVVIVLASLLVAGCQSAAPDVASKPGSDVLAYAAGSADPRYAALVIDDNGSVLHADHADSLRYPASLTKMMTLYILFEEMQAGRLAPGTQLAVSANAARQPPSRLGLKAGSTIRVSDAVTALAVKSCNDVATVVAENIAGSEAAFADRMNRTARALGMSRTTFRNASGLPDPSQQTTARDVARLATALQRRFPQYDNVFAVPSFTYAGRTYKNTNKLVGDMAGMDFSKTGYTRDSGYNLVTSVRRGGKRILVVALGAPSGAVRSARVRDLVAEYLPERRWLAFGD